MKNIIYYFVLVDILNKLILILKFNYSKTKNIPAYR